MQIRKTQYSDGLADIKAVLKCQEFTIPKYMDTYFRMKEQAVGGGEGRSALKGVFSLPNHFIFFFPIFISFVFYEFCVSLYFLFLLVS